MLSIRVGRVLCSIPSEQVTHIDYVSTITPLPFADAPVEGLVNVNARPLLQVNVADALGLEQEARAGNKRLIVNTPQGDFALRVDEVVGLVKTKTTPPDENQQPLPQLQLKEILPQALIKFKKPTAALKQNNPSAHLTPRKLTVLLVATSGKTIALLAHNIDHIQEMTSLQTLEKQSVQGDLLVKVKDHLLPTHSLAQLLQLEADEESVAVIVRGKQATWALRVRRVIGIENIEQVYSSGTGNRDLWCVTQTGKIRELIDANRLGGSGDYSAPRLWYVTRNGHIQELIDADRLSGGHSDSPSITLIAPEQTSSALQRSERLTTEGLRIYCGAGSYLLPLTMATRTLESMDSAVMAASRFAGAGRSNRAGRIPWIDAAALLFGRRSAAIKNTVAIALADDGQVLLGVDRVLLSQSLSAAEKWVDADLPYPVTLFFDAACYDEQTGQWILRAVNTVRFSGLPWTIKKTLAKAIIGWFDCHRQH